MGSLDRKLRAVFDKGGVVGAAEDQNHHYIPRAIDGGPAWRVYDRLAERFLTDREVKKASETALRSEQLPLQ